MKKIIIVLLAAFAVISVQQVDAQGKGPKKKVYTSKYYTAPNGKAVGYKGTNPRRKHIAYPPYGKAVGYKGRNPNRARGKYKH